MTTQHDLLTVEHLVFHYNIGWQAAEQLQHRQQFTNQDLNDWTDFKEQATIQGKDHPQNWTRHFLQKHKNPTELKWFKLSRKETVKETKTRQVKEISREPGYARPAEIKSNPDAVGWEEYKKIRGA